MRAQSVAGARFGEGEGEVEKQPAVYRYASLSSLRYCLLKSLQFGYTDKKDTLASLTKLSVARDGVLKGPRRSVQWGADIDSPRVKKKKGLAFVGGEMNYEVILNAKEKELLKAKTLRDQVQSALTEMRDLRVANTELLKTLGVDVSAVDVNGNEIEEEREPEPWELEMIAKISAIEKRFADLDFTLSEVII